MWVVTSVYSTTCHHVVSTKPLASHDTKPSHTVINTFMNLLSSRHTAGPTL
jgi:hypothetical protein